MVTIGNYNELLDNSRSNYKTLIKIFLKSRKKRIITNCFFGLFMIILLTSFFVIWNSYRDTSFQGIINQQNWNDNSWVSFYDVYGRNLSLTFHNDYLDNAVVEVTNLFESYFPNSIINYSSYLSFFLRDLDTINRTYYYLKTFDVKASTLLNQSLISGRLPRNNSEILFYKSINSSYNYSINQTITLEPSQYLWSSSDTINYTVCGIVESLDLVFVNNNLSKDLLSNQAHKRFDFFDNEISIAPFDLLDTCTFLTTPNYFFELLNSFNSSMSIGFTLAIDFEYDPSSFNINTIDSCIEDYTPIYFSKLDLNFGTDIYFRLGGDILERIFYFNYYWPFETFRVGATSICLFVLIIFAMYEIHLSGEKELKNIIKRMKLQGLTNKVINRLVVVENTIISGIAISGGIISGLIIGYSLNILLRFNQSFVQFWNNSKNPSLLIIYFIFLTGYSFWGLFSRISTVKKVTLEYSHQYKGKIERKNFLKLILLKEGIWLVFFGSLFGIGLFQFISHVQLVEYADIGNYYFGFNSNIIYAILLLILISGILTVFSLLIIISKIINRTCDFISQSYWSRKKNLLSLSFKNFSNNLKYYNKFLIGILLIGMTTLPGIMIQSNIDRHVSYNATLANSCVDLTINNYDLNDNLRDQINQIEGIDKVTEITLCEIDSETEYSQFNAKNHLITLLVINTTEFVQTIDSTKLGKNEKYTIDDILLLKTNLTYFMDDAFTKKNGFNKGKLLSVNDFLNSKDSFDLRYVCSFKTFPGIPISNEPMFSSFFPDIDKFQLVLDINTFNTIINNSYDYTIVNFKKTVLINTHTFSNLTYIKHEIKDDFNVAVFSIDDRKEEMIDGMSNFVIVIQQIITVISILFAFFFAYSLGNEIYQNQLRNIEFSYRLGATRQQIGLGFAIILTPLVIVPLLFSEFLSVFLVKIYSVLLNVDQSYSMVSLWIPLWLITSVFLILNIFILSGWFLGFHVKLKRYQPIKQE